MEKKGEDTFRILIATDSHLGYQEKDPIRGNDSLVTFEEVLFTAKKKDVDFILLAGDLFHENKPSRKILHDTMSLFRKYCFGDKPVSFQILSQQQHNFKHCFFPLVNYEDPNLNVGIPVFSIHGNHDDPAGSGSLCSLDLLSASGLVNYFGKFTSLESMEVSPILLQKGATKLAMYGLGSMKDERLHRMMRDSKVSMLCPKDKSSEWFNLMAIHQNRVKHGATNYIPEEFLDELLDLVIWGHEHECRITPEWNSRQEFCVSQPGSSIATSLCHGEKVPKKIGILEIHKKDYRMVEVPLQTVRQMYVEDIDLQELKINFDLMMAENVMEYCKEKVEMILRQANIDHTGHSKQPKLPLVRLRVEYTQEDQMFNIHRFGQIYCDKVANPKELVLFHRRRIDKGYKHQEMKADVNNMLSLLNREDVETTRVEDVVKSVFKNLDESKQLMLLTEDGLTDALQEFVMKEEGSAISEFIKYQIKTLRKHLMSQEFDEDSLEQSIATIKNEIMVTNKSSSSDSKVAQKFSKANIDKNGNNVEDDVEMDADDDQSISSSYNQSRGALSGRGNRGRLNKQSKNDFATTSKRNNSDFKSTKNKHYSSSDENGQLTDIIDDDSDEDISFVKERKVPSKVSKRHPAKKARGGRSSAVGIQDKNKTVKSRRGQKNSSPVSLNKSSPSKAYITNWFSPAKKDSSAHVSDSDDLNTQSASTKSVLKSSSRSKGSRKGFVFFDEDD